MTKPLPADKTLASDEIIILVYPDQTSAAVAQSVELSQTAALPDSTKWEDLFPADSWVVLGPGLYTLKLREAPSGYELTSITLLNAYWSLTHA